MVATVDRQAAQALVERLGGRRSEIEHTLLTRVCAVCDPDEVGDPEYALGVRSAVTVALDYALRALAASEAQKPVLPAELMAQARSAARLGVDLETVLRRYIAGYTFLTDCLVREATSFDAGLVEVMRSQAELFDGLIAAITEAYSAETKERLKTGERRRAERVRRLLRGELVDPSDLGYPLGGWHLGVVASGPAAKGVIQGLASRMDCRLLMVHPGGEAIWAWLGARRAPDPVPHLRGTHLGSDAVIALGEPKEGIGGWRASHRQAQAALPVARRIGRGCIRYAEVALLSASLGNEVLAEALREQYVEPLCEERDGGAALKRTARAYLAAGLNVSAAAAALRVSRTTVTNHLRTIEERIGRPPAACASELETALALHELTSAD